MRYLLFLSLFLSPFVFAEVGKISKVIGTEAYVLRSGSKITAEVDLDLQKDDEIHAGNSYIVLFIYPASQVSLNKNSSIKISDSLIEENKELEKAFSVIDYIKGIIRLQVTKSTDQEINQKVQANGVAFAVRGTEFEISEGEDDSVDLDVIEGEVEVSSPLVATFVPEIVKANEGFRFERKKRHFSRRKFMAKFRNHPGFERPERVRQKWKELRQHRRAKKENKMQNRMENRNQTKMHNRMERQNRKANKHRR